MSENSNNLDVNEILAEAESIIKEPKFITHTKKVLENSKIGLVEAFKNSSIANRDMAACIALAQLLSKEMPDVANRLHLYEIATQKTDPNAGIINTRHHVLGFADPEGKAVDIIDPLFLQYENQTPYLVGPRSEVLPKYTDPSNPHPVETVRITPAEIVDFMQQNSPAIKTFAKALQAA